MTSKARKLPRIYLQDQDTLLLISQRVARRSGISNKGTPHGDFLAALSGELEDDSSSLESVMGRLDVQRSRLKRASTWGAEKIGRLKLNGRLIRYSDLSRVYEAESLTALIGMKRSMWRSLKENYGHQELAGVDLDDLIDKATKQLAGLESHRGAAAKTVLAP